MIYFSAFRIGIPVYLFVFQGSTPWNIPMCTMYPLGHEASSMLESSHPMHHRISWNPQQEMFGLVYMFFPNKGNAYYDFPKQNTRGRTVISASTTNYPHSHDRDSKDMWFTRIYPMFLITWFISYISTGSTGQPNGCVDIHTYELVLQSFAVNGNNLYSSGQKSDFFFARCLKEITMSYTYVSFEKNPLLIWNGYGSYGTWSPWSIYRWCTYDEKWWFSIAMFDHQLVDIGRWCTVPLQFSSEQCFMPLPTMWGPLDS